MGVWHSVVSLEGPRTYVRGSDIGGGDFGGNTAACLKTIVETASWAVSCTTFVGEETPQRGVSTNVGSLETVSYVEGSDIGGQTAR